MNEWQQVGRLVSSYEKGELRFVVLKSRGTGKSMIAQNMIRFSDSWTKWKDEWSWKPRVSSRSGNIIWGNIMVRKSKFVLSNFGREVIEYASPNEALKQQREEFKEILSRG